MLGTRRGLRVLGPGDLPEVQQLLARDPVTHVFVDHRVRLTRLEPRWLGGEIWGYDEGRGLVSLCHAAANLVAGPGHPAALTAYATRALQQGRKCGSIMGVHERGDGAVAAARAGLGPGPIGAATAAVHGARRPTGSRRIARTSAGCGPTRSTCCTRPAWRCTPRSSASRPRPTAARRSTGRGSPS